MEREYDNHLMKKVTTFRKSQSGELLVRECMFDDAVLAQIFVDACEKQNIAASMNKWTWETLIEKSM